MDGLRLAMEKATVVITMHGEIDACSADRLGLELVDLATSCSAARCLVVNLREVSFLDSCGLQMLVGAHHDLHERSVESFFVVAEGSMTARLLQITGLDGVLSVHPRMGEALEAARRCIEAAAVSAPSV